MLSRVSCVRLFVTPWTVARQVPLPTGFPKQEYWSGLPFPPPRDLSDPGIEPASPMSPAMQETRVQSLSQKDPLEEEMATHSSILAWRISWTEEPVGLHTVHGVAESYMIS